MTNKYPFLGENVLDHIERMKAADPEFAAAFDAAAAQREVAYQVRDLRQKAGLSQEDLAARVGTKQPAIARIESGSVMPKLDLLHRIALALGFRARLEFEPVETGRKRVPSKAAAKRAGRKR